VQERCNVRNQTQHSEILRKEYVINVVDKQNLEYNIFSRYLTFLKRAATLLHCWYN